jgi:hypothetical protein
MRMNTRLIRKRRAQPPSTTSATSSCCGAIYTKALAKPEFAWAGGECEADEAVSECEAFAAGCREGGACPAKDETLVERTASAEECRSWTPRTAQSRSASPKKKARAVVESCEDDAFDEMVRGKRTRLDGKRQECDTDIKVPLELSAAPDDSYLHPRLPAFNMSIC